MMKVHPTQEFVRWYKSLDASVRPHVARRITYLGAMGHQAEEPIVKPIVATSYDMGEIVYSYIPGKSPVTGNDPDHEVHIRVLFIFDSDSDAIVLLGGDKTRNWQSWYTQNIARAEALYDLYKKQHPST